MQIDHSKDNLMDWPETLYTQIYDEVDWSRPELAPFRTDSPDKRRAVLGVIAHLRQRTSPNVGYSRQYVDHVRQKASVEERAAARERIVAALSQNILMPYHRNAFSILGAETIYRGSDLTLCRQVAARVWECREQWPEGLFGVTGSIAQVIRMFWPVEECEDEAFVPLFGWLLTRWKPEWESARGWTESMLGISSHNWWCHTFSGFWAMGLCFPEFKGVGQFQSLSPDFAERALRLLFAADGWSKECSPGYHDFAFSGLQEMVHLGEMNGAVWKEETRNRLHQIADASWKLMAPDGDFPAFGDHVPYPRFLRMTGVERPDLLACAHLRRQAARFHLPEAKFVAEALDPSWKPYGGILPDEGEDLLQAYQAMPSQKPVTVDTCLPHAAYYMMRQDWTPRADWIAIEAGEFGSRVASHRHSSIFNFELCARGRRLLVDNWYGPVYEDSDAVEARMWRIGSTAHNVATVDEQSQVPVKREYVYGATVPAIVDDWRSQPEYAYFSGVHEGYLQLEQPVAAARRKIFYLRGQYWILIDRFTPAGAAQHTYTQHFHISAPAELGQEDRVVTQGEGGNLLFIPVHGASSPARLEPCPFPVENYENPAHLRYSATTEGKHLLVTVLVPFENADIPQVQVKLLEIEADGRILSSWEATALEIEMTTPEGTRRDVYFDQHMEWNLPWQAGAYSGRGRLFHSNCPSLNRK